MTSRTWNLVRTLDRTVISGRTRDLLSGRRTVEPSLTELWVNRRIRTERSVITRYLKSGAISRTEEARRTCITVVHCLSTSLVFECTGRTGLRFDDSTVAVVTDGTRILRVVSST